ncbi:MAG: DUF6691 family protein [Planctomycetota bacterium]
MRLICFLLGGALFGAGLARSGMTRPEVVLEFLRFEDLGLLLVMGGAIGVALPVFRLARRPLLGGAPEAFTATLGDRRWLGSVLFGLGWGIAGVCPGAALASIGTGNTPLLWAVGGMFLGAFVQGRFRLLAPAAETGATDA